jgi:hypothetical protein
MAIYNMRVKRYAYFYFKEDEYFKNEMHVKFYERALREWLDSSSNVIALKEVAHSELGNKAVRLFKYRLSDLGVNESDKRVKLAIQLGLYDYIKSLFREFDQMTKHQS